MDRVTGLHIRSRRGGAEAPRVQGVLHLDADTEWLVEGSAEEVAGVIAALSPAVCSTVVAGVALLNFGNRVGRIARVGQLGPVVVQSGKWTEAQYDRMLQELSETVAALPFSANSPTSLPFERTDETSQHILLHAFVWLRHALLDDAAGELRGAVAGVLRNPHRRLVQRPRTSPVEHASRFSAALLNDVASGRWPFMEHGGGIEVAGRRVLPVRVTEQYARPDVDTAENRFVRAFLDACDRLIVRMRRLAEAKGAKVPPSVLTDCVRMAQIVRSWLQDTLWSAVGAMEHFPAGSSVLQRRHEYRTVLRHHLLLHSGSRVPIEPKALHHLLEAKDIATLYELWVAFRVLRTLSDCLGPPRDVVPPDVTDGGSSLSRGLLARWPGGIELAYNPAYTLRRGFHGRSRSLTVRPDIALFLPRGQNRGLHLFDAKFRLQRGSESASRREDETYKSADLHRMHAYRDAIPDARSAWVVYPGADEDAFLDDGRRGMKTLSAGPLRGVGVLSVAPERTSAGLAAVVTALVGGADETSVGGP